MVLAGAADHAEEEVKDNQRQGAGQPTAELWGWPLISRQPTGRKRTRAAAAVIGLLSLVWFRGGWDYGLKSQDFHYTLTTAIGSFVFAAAIAAILASRERADRFAWSLAANFLLFAWLQTYAFPYLGELP